MRPDSDRWVEITPSVHTHERSGLEQVRSLLPDAEPYRAWSNLEIVTDRGENLEIDLLVLGPAGLFLVELKHWAGRIGGDRYTWTVNTGRRRTVDSPLFAADRKAKILKTQLNQAYDRLPEPLKRQVHRARVVPWIEAAILLHHPESVCELAPEHRASLYGPQGPADRTTLPGIVDGLLMREPRDPDTRVGAQQSSVLAKLMRKAGMGRRRQRTVGSYLLDERPFDTGPAWQDYLARHRRFPDEVRRVRIYNVGSATTTEGQLTLERAAEREYRLLRDIKHPGLVVPLEHHDTPMGPALVYAYDSRALRLDHFLAEHSHELTIDDQVGIIRRLADIVRYAHGRHITHRGLSPRSVLVTPGAAGPAVQIADWQTGAHVAATSSSGMAIGTVMAGTRHVDSLLDQRFEVYQAPEAGLRADANEVRIDVFSLGALGYLVLTGQPPAADLLALRQRIQETAGLDLAAHLDGAPAAVRALVLDATRGAVNDRLPDMEAFLERVAAAEAEIAEPEPAPEVDPIEAPRDAVLGGRWKVVRNLGSGASAVALLVEDLRDAAAPRVLKIAHDADRAARLRDEAAALRGLDDPRIARLREEEPITLGGRTALVLEHAGDRTLASLLNETGRLSLDRLERFGDDLLGIAAYLDSHDVSHRDIKPANLGVRERPGDHQKHLVLFDFSLSRASTGDIQAGTPPYLDPFLGTGRRLRWDDHAERYAVAVTLFEMATGRTPRYGDGQSYPAVLEDEATIEPHMFDPAAGEPLVAFFRRALRREAAERFQTTEHMRHAWLEAIRLATRALESRWDPDTLAAQAALDTPLAGAGLSARAISALEQHSVATVGGLLSITGGRLSRLAGANEATRLEIRKRAREWRQRLVEVQPGTGAPVTPPEARSIEAVIDRLVPSSRGRNSTEIRGARLLLGRPADPGADGPLPTPWLGHGELARLLDVTRARAHQIDTALKKRWSEEREGPMQQVRDDLVEHVRASQGVVTAGEAAAWLLAQRGSTADEPLRTQTALGLVRVAVETELELGGRARLDRRRRDELVLIALEPAPGRDETAASRRIDYAIALGRFAAELLAGGETPMSSAAAIDRLRTVTVPDAMPTIDERRLLRLAAAASGTLAVSIRDELYRRGMSAAAALRHSGAVFATPGAHLTVETLRERVRVRFPEAELLPDRPWLDDLLAASGVILAWDPALDAYRPQTVAGLTLSTFTSRHASAAHAPDLVMVEEVERRLLDAVDGRAFLALGVHAEGLEHARTELARRHGARVVDVTALLIARMREVAAEKGIPWDAVLAADAAGAGSREGEGLRGLVTACVGAVSDALESGPPDIPVVLTDAGPLARYGHLGLLARLADHTTRRPHAVWLLVPAREGQSAPTLDREPVPIVSASQWLRLSTAWLDAEASSAQEAVR
jgi:serine/threonine protein kinase